MHGIFLVPYYSREPRRASRVRGFSFYMAWCSRLWRVSVLSTLPGQRPEPIRAPGFFVCLSLAARAEPRRLFRAPFAGSARSRYAIRAFSFSGIEPTAWMQALFRSLFTHENNPDILLIGKMFGLFVLTVRIGFNDGK